jgi:hypothetical protein
MNDRVARVEKHPVAKRQAFDFRRRIAGVAAGLHHPIGNRADMRARASGGDDHAIGERRFARELYRNDVLRFRVLETFNDGLGEGIGGKTVDMRFAGFRRRIRMRRECQRRVPNRRGTDSPALLINMRRRQPLFKP